MKKLKEVVTKTNRPTMADVTLDQLMSFLERGSLADAPEELVLYVNALDAIRGMSIRIDLYPNKEQLVKEIMFLYDVPKVVANRLYAEMVEYFYADEIISKTAYKNKYADMLDRIINFSMLAMRSVDDALKVSKQIREVIDVRQLLVPDEKTIDEMLYKKPYTVISLDGNLFETGISDRGELNEIIETFKDLTEREKSSLKQDAMIELPINPFRKNT